MNSKNFFQRFINKIIPLAGKAAEAKKKATQAPVEGIVKPGTRKHGRSHQRSVNPYAPSKFYVYGVRNLPKLGKSIH
jgi:hypothetical protein